MFVFFDVALVLCQCCVVLVLRFDVMCCISLVLWIVMFLYVVESYVGLGCAVLSRLISCLLPLSLCCVAVCWVALCCVVLLCVVLC